jgi:DNA adenine methylase
LPQKKQRFKGDCGVISAAMRRDADVPQKPVLSRQGQGVTATKMVERAEKLKAPFPWFGGKSRAASLIWARLGDVDTYNEPFAGSLAVLLGRPHAPRFETVNDLDAYLSNFWRALQRDPETVAYWADFPVNETDLHARHRWLVQSRKARASIARVKAEPDYFDAKIAGWWVWGQCLWIGSGWCQRPEWTGRGVGAAANRGVHNQAMSGQKPGSVRMEGAIQRKRFAGTGNGQGVGVHRRWQGGGQGGGSGVHAPRLTEQMPRISAEGGSISGVTATPMVQSGGLYDYLVTLAARLRRVRVCCGDWHRVLTPSVTTYVGLCGVVLDPPYSHDMRERCYSEDHDISGAVREWAITNGDNPQFRIALCGYEGEHAMPDSWECVEWKAHGGYARTERGKENRERERVWFSPHCLKANLPLFGGLDDEPEAEDAADRGHESATPDPARIET